nr:hypothetical protein CFP56_39622 [Quercus suber]
MDAGNKKWVEIRKATTLCVQQSGGLLVPSRKVGQKRKHSTDGGKSNKKGPIANPLVPLSMRSKGFTVDTACLLVQYVDLDECLEHEIDAFGDSGLFHLTRITEYKESMPTLSAKVNTQKVRISELEKSACQVDELTKENTNLTNLHKQMDKAKVDVVDDF